MAPCSEKQSSLRMPAENCCHVQFPQQGRLMLQKMLRDSCPGGP